MKKNLFTAFFLLTIFISYGQKIPFQGKLTQADEPFTGSVTIDFSIQDLSWSETHEGVGVVDGFYSVVLGEITPLPDSIFAATGEEQLAISVDGTALSTVTLHEALISKYISNHFDGTNDAPAVSIKRTGAAGSGYAAMEVVSEMEGTSYALYGQSSGAGSNYGVYGYANGAGLTNWGVFGIGRGSGDGTTGYNSGSYNDGVVGWAAENTWGNTGVYGRVYGAEGVDNNAVIGIAEVNNNSDTIINNAVHGRAMGPGVNYGIRGFADGGVENWAGWFDGDVNVNGQLMVNGQVLGSGGDTLRTGFMSVSGDQGKMEMDGLNAFPHFSFYSPAGDQVTKLGIYEAPSGTMSYFDLTSGYRSVNGMGAATTLGVTNNNFGYLRLGGSNDLNSEMRVHLVVDSVGTLGSAGKLELLGPVGNSNGDPISLFQVSGVNNAGGPDALGVSAEMSLWGDSSPNFLMGGNSWEENDFASFNMYGSNSDGGSWFLSNLEMNVSSDGSYESANIDMYNSEVGSAYHTVSLRSNGNNNGGHLELKDLNSTERIDIFSTGINAGVNPYDEGYVINMDAGGGPLMEMYTAGAATILLNGRSGSISATTLMSSDGTVQSSDARLKENVQTLENALNKTRTLRGVSYNWIDKSKSQKEQIGVIAQEVEEVYPQFVHTDEKGMKAVNYAQMVAVLIEAVKELDAKVASLETENAELRASLENKQSEELAELQAEIESIKKLIGITTMGASK